MYHAGNRQLQDAFGSRALADRLDEKLRRSPFNDDDAAFIGSLGFFFLATADARGRPDCSFKGGPPGFARAGRCLGAWDEGALALRRVVVVERRGGIEVALHRAAGFEVDLAIVERAQCKTNAAFHLRANHVGIDGYTAVNRADHALHFDLAIAHRHKLVRHRESIHVLVLTDVRVRHDRTIAAFLPLNQPQQHKPASIDPHLL